MNSSMLVNQESGMNGQSPCSDAITAFCLDPIPDFLEDHRFLGSDVPSRLVEHHCQWIQFIRGLWKWRNQGAFCLRFIAGLKPGRIDCYLLARARRLELCAALREDVTALLHANRLCFREVGQIPLMFSDFGDRPVISEITQHFTPILWNAGSSFAADYQKIRGIRNGENSVNPGLQSSVVVFPWWGPEGSYLLPMECLVRTKGLTALSIYLQPTLLRWEELVWLREMAAAASSLGEQTRKALGMHDQRLADPSATLAGELYLAHFRRLTHPFLTSVQVVTTHHLCGFNYHLAGVYDAIVREKNSGDGASDKPLPSGADIFPGGFVHSRTQFDNLFYPDDPEHFRDPIDIPGFLNRMRFLVDAEGAATVFRLPVSLKSGVPGMTVAQLPPDFNPGPRVLTIPEGHLNLGQLEDGGYVTIPVEDLTKHALITGFTGSGKTVTVLRLLHQLWDKFNIPFLVLESAKQEYRGLFGVGAFHKDLRVYTLGNETAVPFRLNPFELLPGVRVEAHIGRLQVCFEAAMPPVGPSSSVIAEALVIVYQRSGWTITDTCPERPPRRQFPLLSDFVETVREVIKDRKYEGEVLWNVTAAIVGRLSPLLIGSKGRMFDCRRSHPTAQDLFSRPTVLEMNDLNLDDKALVVLFLLTLLREYRERQFRQDPNAPGKLAHVTLIEEAHNVLADIQSSGNGEGAGADTRYKAVEAFCVLLTEVRALGEGLIIADQSPEKLAADAVRNTNLQIVHQLRDGHDREAMANAMIMSDEQRDYVGKLKPGRAALFRTGLERTTFITVPTYYALEGHLPDAGADGTGFDRNLTDESVVQRMEQLEPDLATRRRPALPYLGCDLCPKKSTCPYHDAAWAEFARGQGVEDLWKWAKLNESKPPARENWMFLVQVCRDGANRIQSGQSAASHSAAWCYLVHLWHGYYGDNPVVPLKKTHFDNFISFLERAER